MNHMIKGALLSGLVFPGLGQIVLKHYKRGAALLLAFTATLVAMLILAVQQASIILDKIESEGGVIDTDKIANAASQASTTSASHTLTLLSWLLIFCWVLGIVDACRIGRKKDSQGRFAHNASNAGSR
jgi:hypothetical protein